MSAGFAQLTADFLSEVLSRKHKQAVRVQNLTVTEYHDRADLRKLAIESTVGPVELMVKILPQNRRRETEVWAFLAQAGALPLPELYHAEFDQRLGSYGVILEFIPPLMEVERWDDAQCRRVGAALATVHGRFWAKTDELPEPFAAPETPPEATVEPAVRRFLDRLSGTRQAVLYADVPDVLTLLAKLLRMAPAFFAEPTDLPQTLIHGALDRTEVLFRPHGAGPQPVLIDWCDARVGRGSEDLAMLVNSLPADRQSAARASLLAGYLEGLAAAEIAVPADRIAGELDRQRVLHGCKKLPVQCNLYVERSGEPAHQQWCERFVEEAAHSAAAWRRILVEQGRQDRHAPPPEPPEIA